MRSGNTAWQKITDANRRKSSSGVEIEGVTGKVRVFVEDSTVIRADKVLNKGDDVVVCVPLLRIDYVRERMQKVLGSDKSILVRVGINNSETDATTAIVMNHRRLFRALKQTRVENTIMARILLVMGGRDQGYRHCVRMAINTLVQQLCGEETVRLLDLWGCFVGGQTCLWGWAVSEWNGGCIVCRTVASWTSTCEVFCLPS